MTAEEVWMRAYCASLAGRTVNWDKSVTYPLSEEDEREMKSTMAWDASDDADNALMYFCENFHCDRQSIKQGSLLHKEKFGGTEYMEGQTSRNSSE